MRRFAGRGHLPRRQQVDHALVIHLEVRDADGVLVRVVRGDDVSEQRAAEAREQPGLVPLPADGV